jgi:hypothetical protein
VVHTVTIIRRLPILHVIHERGRGSSRKGVVRTPSYRSDMFNLQVQVSGVVLDTISWDSCDGGEISVESQNVNLGGMAPAIALGGKRSRSDMTVKRIWNDTLIGAYIALDAAAGSAPVTISVQTLSAAKQPVGAPLVYTGILGPVTRPAFEATTSSPIYLQMVVSLNETIS